MAILNTGRFVSAITNCITENRETSYTLCDKKTYVYDCRYRKEDPTKIVKWLRRNFGERGIGWDFHLNKNSVIIEIWHSNLITMYEMWIV